MGPERSASRKPAVAERRPVVVRSPVAPVARAMPTGAGLQQRLGNGGTQTFAGQVIARQPTPVPAPAPTPPPLVPVPPDPETELIDALADYLLQTPDLFTAFELSKAGARKLQAIIEQSKTDDDEYLRDRLKALDKKQRAKVAGAAVAQVQGALAERRADKVEAMAKDIVARTHVRFAALADIARAAEEEEAEQIRLDPKKKAKRAQFGTIRKYILKDTIYPQIDVPRTKPYPLRADYRGPLGLAETDPLFPDLHEVGFIEDLKSLPKSMRQALKDEVDKLTLVALADYIQTRMGTQPATILAEWAREFARLVPRIRGNIEGGLSGWTAVRMEILGQFGSPPASVDDAIAAINAYFQNDMVECEFLANTDVKVGPKNTIVHTALNAALLKAEAFMKAPARMWRDEVIASLKPKGYWATNIRENRNAPARPSEHTYGWAVDVSADDNPNLAKFTQADWDFVSAMAGERAIYEQGGKYTEGAQALRNPAASTEARMMEAIKKIRSQSAGLATTFSSESNLRARLRAIVSASPAGIGKKPAEIDALLDIARKATTGPGKDRLEATKLLQLTLQTETFKRQPIASEPEGAASPLRTKLARLLAPQFRELGKATEAEAAIRTQIVTPVDKVTADARKRNVGALFTKSIVKELNAVPAVDRPELVRQVLRDLRAPLVRKGTDKDALAFAGTLKRAFDVLDSTVVKGAKVGTGGGMANIAVHGFSNLNEKLVVSLVHPQGANLAWLGVVNQDMHHFQLRSPPKLPKVPAPVPLPLPQPTAPPAPPTSAVQQGAGNEGAQPSPVIARSAAPGGSAVGGTQVGQYTLSHPDDAQEREADRMADLVMRGPQPGRASIPMKPTSTVQRTEGTAHAAHITPSASASIDALKSSGHPLPLSARAFFEPRFGADFSGVRIHTDSNAEHTAQSINAKAFTVGSDIAFAAGQSALDSDAGQRLLAHELTHVMQQDGGQSSSTVFRTEDKGNADSLIVKYRDSNGGIDTKKLGELLFRLAWMSPDHYPLVVDTIDKLEAYDADDDVAEIVAGSSRDDNLQTFASNPAGLKMLRKLESAMYGGFTTSGERQQIFRLRGAIAQQTSAEKGQAAGLKLLDKAAAAPGAATPKQGGALLTLAQIGERFRLIEAVLARLGKRYEKDPVSTLPIAMARSRLAAERGGASVTNAAELSRNVPDAQVILERTEAVLLNLDLQLAGYRTTPTDPTSTAYAMMTERVRGAYLGAVALLLKDSAVPAFETAERIAVQLPRALAEVDLAQLEGRAPTTDLLEGNRIAIADWAGRVRTQMDAIEADAQAIADARTKNAPDLPARIARFERQRDMIELSLRALAHWDRALRAHEYLVGEGAVHWAGYTDTNALRIRCMAMKAAADADDLKLLREKVRSYEIDPAILDFFKKKIPVYLMASRMLVSLGITLAAAAVTAGIGSAFSSTITATTTAGRALALAGTAAIEAITFTAASRGLATIAPGPGPQGGAFGDLAWNFGLFALMRIAGGAVRTSLAARGLESLEKPVNLVASASLLQAYGVVRFRAEEGRWPSGDELARMTGDNLMMLIGITLVTRSIPKLFEANTKYKNLRTFARKYAWRFEGLEAGRQSLLNQFRVALETGKATDAAEIARLQAAGKTVEDALKSLIDQIKGDRGFSLEGAAKELEALGLGKVEGSEELLARGLGLPEDVLLRWAGALDEYTYRWGGTSRLENALRALGAIVEKTVEPATGLRTLTANFKDRPSMTFVEREAPLSPATKEVDVPLNAPELLKLLTEFGINDPAAQRYVVRMLAAELAKSPEHGLASASKPVRATLRRLAETAKKAGTSMEHELLELRQRGVHGVKASPALLALVDSLVGQGILKSVEWLSARTSEEFSGAVSELLGYAGEVSRSATGESVLRRVHIIGDLFEDAALTKPRLDKAAGQPRTGVDVVPELDLLVVVDKGGGRFEIQRLANIKGYASGVADAKSQNQLSLDALRAHARGTSFEIKTRDGATLYARVTNVVGYTAAGAEVPLTGRLAEALAGASTHTIGPKDARGFDQALSVKGSEINDIVRILRERQARTSPDY